MQNGLTTFPFDVYDFLLHSSAVICLCIGVFALTQREFKSLVSQRYLTARYIFGIVLIIFAVDMTIDFFLHYLSEMRQQRQIVRTIIIQTEYTLYCLMFFSLIDFNHFNRKRFLVDGIWWLVTTVTTSASWVTHGLLSDLLLYTGIASLGIYMTYSIIRYFILHRNFHHIMNNYYSDEVYWLSRWMRRGIILLSIYGYIGLTNLLTQIVPYLFYISYELFVNVFVFIAFQNFRLKYKSIEEAIKTGYTNDLRHKRRYDPNSQEFMGGLSPDNLQRLDDWLLHKGYRHSGITIHQLAVDIGTNRLYLSQYINQKHGCNFSEWVNRMRVEDAKAMIREKPDITIEEVAITLGFSSGSYFSKIFTKAAGISPGSFRKSIAAPPPPIKEIKASEANKTLIEAIV